MLKDYPDVLTVAQLAEILGISRNSAYRLVNERTIGSRRIGRAIRIPKACLIDYLNSARYSVSQT
jgi:excisionase family DNA binding protein